MRNVWIIARREYKYYFTSSVVYAVVFFFMLLLGIFFYLNMAGAITQAAYQAYAPDVQIVIGPMVTLLLFVMPAVTMRSISEEVRSGTMELLLTSPVRDWELVVGKWLGAFFFMLSLLAITLIFPLVLNFLIKPGIDQGLLVSGYLGLVMMVASMVAVGVLVSSIFSNQVVAFFVALGVLLILWFVSQFASSAAGLGNQLLNYLDFPGHFNNFYQGIINLSDIVYFLSLTALALVLGTVSIEIRRWR